MKIKLITLFIIAIGLTIFSCTTDNSEMNNNHSSEIILAKNIEFIGVEHNEMLDEAYLFLKESSNNKSLISQQKSLENFLISRINANIKYSKNSNKIAIENVQNLFKLGKNNIKSSYEEKEYSNLLSLEEKEYLKILDKILEENINEDQNRIEEKILILEKDIEKDENLNNEQLITLFSATQTAKYSYIYWKENWKKWKDLNKNKSTLKQEEDDGHNGCDCESVKTVAKADVAGAVGGAAYAWAANLIPGAGQVAYGGAIVGTAAAGSAIAAFYEIFGE